ncbi:hypothetical protein [Gemmata obscuriglobus]|uniref:hypothetical protein n=1 Tax=Gemmata obscuriglobus TaxID=114 RepID=UPI0002EEDC52|nr:hypothetical protein [Gemmata obscuriglobus]
MIGLNAVEHVQWVKAGQPLPLGLFRLREQFRSSLHECRTSGLGVLVPRPIA